MPDPYLILFAGENGYSLTHNPGNREWRFVYDNDKNVQIFLTETLNLIFILNVEEM